MSRLGIEPALDIEPPMIALRGGLAIAEPALLLAVSLADRGATFRLDEAGALRAGPRRILTADDAAAIRDHRDDLLAIIKYCDAPPEVV